MLVGLEVAKFIVGFPNRLCLLIGNRAMERVYQHVRWNIGLVSMLDENCESELFRSFLFTEKRSVVRQ